MREKRSLTFTDWDSIESDLRLLLQGYESLGKWNLAQTAMHLNDWLNFPMDGFPTPPFPLRLIFPIIRLTVGRKQLREILANGFLPNIPTMPSTVHEATAAQDRAAVEKLLATIARFRQYTGPMKPSPLFGQMDRDTVQKLQFIHFAHHLNLLVPRV